MTEYVSTEPDRRPEPVAIGGAITAATAAVLGALVALDIIEWTAEQTGAVVGAVTAVVALVSAFVVRRQVTPLKWPQDSHGRALVAMGPAADMPGQAEFLRGLDEPQTTGSAGTVTWTKPPEWPNQRADKDDSGPVAG